MYKLSLQKLELELFLGVYDFEKIKPTRVVTNIDICFYDLPLGCKTDDLDDVICYASIIEELRKYTKEKTFQLIEHLAWELAEKIAIYLDNPADISVEVQKKPPVEGLALACFKVEKKWQQK